MAIDKTGECQHFDMIKGEGHIVQNSCFNVTLGNRKSIINWIFVILKCDSRIDWKSFSSTPIIRKCNFNRFCRMTLEILRLMNCRYQMINITKQNSNHELYTIIIWFKLIIYLQNSIRHNLSLHNRFMRVQNEGTGKSSWWMLNPDAKPGEFCRPLMHMD